MTTFPTELRVIGVGIALALYPHPDTTLSLEIQRAPDDSGEPIESEAVTIGVLPPGKRIVVDNVGNSVAIWHYRARHVRLNATSGGFTPWVAARARVLPNILPPIPPLGVFHQDTSVRSMSSATQTTMEEVMIPDGLLGLRGAVLISGTYRKVGATDLGAVNIIVGGFETGGFSFAADDEDEVTIEVTVENDGATDLQLDTIRRARSNTATYQPGTFHFGPNTIGVGGGFDSTIAQSILFTAQLGPTPVDSIELIRTRVEYLSEDGRA